jgi:[protein-PII] uridylyltransferase
VPQRDLGDGTLLFGESVTIAHSASLREDPALALRLYRQVLRLDRPPYSFARDAIARIAMEADWRRRLRESDEARRLFVALLTHVGEPPLRGGSVLGELHEVGLIVAMIPEFETITGRVQHDVYHVYTVDVHSVAAVDRCRALRRGDLASELPLACRLAAEAPRPVPLFVALLLHDLGKAHGKEHASRGAAMVAPIAQRLGLSAVDTEHVEWLVAEHLSLYHWATRRDTSDPAVLEEIARQVGTIERLRDLYLVTVADLSTTNPTAMSSWKARMLEDLYLSVAAVLQGSMNGSAQSRAAQLRDEVRVGFVGDAGQVELEEFLSQMPDRYLLSHPVDMVRTHARIARDRDGRPVHVRVNPGPSEEVSEIVVVTDDRPGLLADVSVVLAANRLAVGGAQIYTRAPAGRAPEAFDVFHVKRQGRPEEPVQASMAAKIERDLADLLAGRVSGPDLEARIPKTPPWALRHRPEVPTEVTVDNEASPEFTVVDVYTRDRPGLLQRIARTLYEQGVSIALSKVNTEGLRVADVFYVEDPGHGKLRDPERLARLQAALCEALDARTSATEPSP